MPGDDVLARLTRDDQPFIGEDTLPVIAKRMGTLEKVLPALHEA